MERAPMLIDGVYPVSEARAYLLAWLYDTFEVDPQHPHRLDNIASVLLHAFHTIENAVPDLVMARGQPLLRVLTDHIDELAAAIYPSQVRARAILNNVPAKSAEWALTVSQLFAMHGRGEDGQTFRRGERAE